MVSTVVNNVYSCLYVCVSVRVGEGLKIGALALVRSNKSVHVDTSLEQWEFVVKHHCQLRDEAVLTVTIKSEPVSCTSCVYVHSVSLSHAPPVCMCTQCCASTGVGGEML